MATEGDPSPPLKLDAFRRLVVASNKNKLSSNEQKFVKKLDSIPSVDLPTERPYQTSMNIVDQGLSAQFTGLFFQPCLCTSPICFPWLLMTPGFSNEEEDVEV